MVKCAEAKEKKAINRRTPVRPEDRATCEPSQNPNVLDLVFRPRRPTSTGPTYHPSAL